MDRELLYNKSGIKDETAYKAIKNIRSGSKADMSGYEINKGEIWEVEGNGNGAKYVAVLACYERYAATIMLQELPPHSNAVNIIAHNMMFADAGRLGWTFYDKMVDFVRVLSPDEDRELRQAIGAALELEVNKVSAATTAAALEARDKAYEAAQQYENEVAELTLRLEASRAEADVLRRNLAEAAQQQTPQQGYVELAAALREAEIYKGLYEQLLARALG